MKIKKLFIALMVLIGTSITTSCVKETVVAGAQVYSYEYTIYPNQWIRNIGTNNPGYNNYLYASFENAYITSDVMAYGTVQAYVWNVYDYSTNSGAWNTLPYVIPIEIFDSHGGLVVVPENLRFEWELGKVTFIIQDLNGIDPEDMTNPITVKVCVTRNI